MKTRLTVATVVLGMILLVVLTGCTIHLSIRLPIGIPVANISPAASFTATPTSGDAPLAVAFDASSSSDSDGSVVTYAWTFGDGGSDSGLTVTHTYNNAGTYTAQLTVTDDDGATDTATQTITVSVICPPLQDEPFSLLFTGMSLSEWNEIMPGTTYMTTWDYVYTTFTINGTVIEVEWFHRTLMRVRFPDECGEEWIEL